MDTKKVTSTFSSIAPDLLIPYLDQERIKADANLPTPYDLSRNPDLFGCHLFGIPIEEKVDVTFLVSERAHKLPRNQQNRIVELVEAYVDRYASKAS